MKKTGTIPKRNNPKVSVLLPFYNVASPLEAAVESIRSQSYTDWELLLLDDGSTDGSRVLAQHLAASDPRIRYIPLPHGGIVAALNHGLNCSEGELIARMDADDISFPDRFLKQVRFLENHPEIDVISSQVEYGGDRRKQAGYAAYVDWQNQVLTPEAHYANRFVDAPVAHPSVMFRRRACGQWGGYREGPFPEDFELWLRWLQAGARMAKLPETLLRWNDFPERLSRSDERYSLNAFYEIKCRYLKTCLPENRPVWLWGAGRITRQRFASLALFDGYIDVNSKKIGQRLHGKPVISPAEIPREAFVICGVANRGARHKMEQALKSSGRKAVQDYLLCA